MLLVRKVMGPETVQAGERPTYWATEFNRPNPSEAEKGQINWLVRCDGEEFERWERKGETLSFEVPAELASKTLLVMPYLNSPTPSISMVTQVRHAPGQILREGLQELRRDFADILGESLPAMPDRELAERIKALKFAVDDILDSAEPLWPDGEDGQEEKRLAIIVGHTERRRGAHAVPPIDQYEHPFNKEVARLLEQAAENRGISARTFLRDGVGIRGAYRAATTYDPDAIIELHFNSFSNPSVRGTETLCSEVNPNSKRLAEIVQQAMVQVFGRGGSTDRGVKVRRPDQRGYVNVTAAPGVPSVLVEPFFGSNEQDCRLASGKLGAYAEALLQGFETFTAES